MSASRVPLSSMANGTVVQKVSGAFLPAPGASASVYLHDPSSTLWGGVNAPVRASVFSTELGVGTLTQPLSADSNGALPGWVNQGQDLDIVASFGGQTAAPALAEPDIASQVVSDSSGVANSPVVAGSGNRQRALRDWFSIVDYGAVGDFRTVTDAAITSGTAILTSATANFTQADVGKLVAVAGASAVNGVLTVGVTILSVQSATQATLSANASLTVSGAAAGWGTNNYTAIQNAWNDAALIPGCAVYHPAGQFAYQAPAGGRADTGCVTVGGSATVTDASIGAGDLGKSVVGNNVATGSYVGTVTPGVSFLLSSSPLKQVNISALGNGTQTLTIGASLPLVPAVSNNAYVGAGMFKTTLWPLQGLHAISRQGASTAQLADLLFEKFAIDGLFQYGGVGIKGIYTNYMLRPNFVRVLIQNCQASGFGVDFLQDYEFDHCLALNNGRGGTQGVSAGCAGFGIGTGAYAVENGDFISCIGRGNKNYGIFFEFQGSSQSTYSTGQKIIGGRYESNWRGVGDCGSQDLRVIGAEIVSNVDAGFAADASMQAPTNGPNAGYNGLVTGCTIKGNAAGKDVVITRNALGSYRVRDNPPLQAFNPDHNGQNGLWAPTFRAGAAIDNLSPVAQRLYMTRFVVEDWITLQHLGVPVLTADSSNDPIVLAILDASAKVLFNSGSTTGIVNTAGQQLVACTFQPIPNTVYYAAFLGTAAAWGSQPVIAGASFGSVNAGGNMWGPATAAYGTADALFLNGQTSIPAVNSTVGAPTGAIANGVALQLVTA